MRIACIVALGGALLSTSLAAQPFTCPEPPSQSDIQRHISAGAEAGLVNRFLSALRFFFERKDVVSENLSHYPNADELYKDLHSFSIQCRAIMARTDLSENQKLDEVAKLADEWIAKTFDVQPEVVVSPTKALQSLRS